MQPEDATQTRNPLPSKLSGKKSSWASTSLQAGKGFMCDELQSFSAPEQPAAVAASPKWDCELMDVAQTARVLQVPVSWVYARTRRRGRDRIPHIKLGKYLRFEPASVREWLIGMRHS
jgi:hypothetical protein